MENSLLNNLVKFIHVLRAAGVRVSLSETMDAVDALSCIDVLDRFQVKAALSACLAKSEAERTLFSESFDRFFIDPEERNAYISHKVKVREHKKQEILERASELQYQGQQLNISDELKEVYSEITVEERKSILDFLERSSGGKNMKPHFKPITENVVKGKLNHLKNKYQKPHGHSCGAFNSPLSEAGIIAEDVTEAVREENSLLYQNLSTIEDKDMPAVIQLIRTMADRLRKSTQSRQRTAKKAGLDFKRTISANTASGGTLFKLKYKKKHGQKQRILTLCDVSASMYRFSGFVLKFISCLHFEVSSADHYIFSQDIEHLNIRKFTTSTDIEHEITKSEVWKKGTDISRAIRHLLTDRFVILNSSTVVIIVSDAKTLNAANAAEGLKQLGDKVKKIYWLNPIQEADWPSIAGIDGLKQYCGMLDCSTLEKLSRACERF
ncbi:MAG TPA: VWA domain-containing protein [Anaerovoracaceae bacterium]|nr:VWA domain-containing protein [Anaerovoracaceae bacterium]